MNKHFWSVLFFMWAVLFWTQPADISAATWTEQTNIPINKEWKVTLSQPYDEHANLATYIQMKKGEELVAVTVEAGSHPQEIRISPPPGGYLPDASYELVIRKGLPSANGQTLAEEVVLPVKTGAALAKPQFEVRANSENTISLKEDVIELSEEDVESLFADTQRLVLNKQEDERTVLAAQLQVGQVLTIPASYDYPFGHVIEITKVIYDAQGELSALAYKDGKIADVIDNIDVSVVETAVDINPDFIRFPNAEERAVSGVHIDIETPEFTIKKLKKGFTIEMDNFGISTDAEGKKIAHIDNGQYDNKIALTIGGEITVDNIEHFLDLGIGFIPVRPVIQESSFTSDMEYALNVGVKGTIGFEIEPILAEIPMPYTSVKLGSKNLKAGVFLQIYLKLEMDANGQVVYNLLSKYTMESTIKKRKWSYIYDQNAIATTPELTQDFAGSIQAHTGIGVGAGLPILIGNEKLMDAKVEVLAEGDMEVGMLHWKDACAKFEAGLNLYLKASIALVGDLAKVHFPLKGVDHSTCKEDNPTFDYEKRSGQQRFTLPTTLDKFEPIVAANKGDYIQLSVYGQQGDVPYELQKWDTKEQGWKKVQSGVVTMEESRIHIASQEKNGYKLIIQSKQPQKEAMTFTYSILSAQEITELNAQGIEQDVVMNHNDLHTIDFILQGHEAVKTNVISSQPYDYYWQYYNAKRASWDTVTGTFKSNLDFSFETGQPGHYRLQIKKFHSDPEKISIKAEVISGDKGETDSRENPRYLTGKTGSATFTLPADYDKDYFEIELQAGQTLIVSTANAKNIEASLYDWEVDGWLTTGVARSSTGDINRGFLVPRTGTYGLVVENYAGHQLEPIQLHYQVLDGDEAEIDSFENPRKMTATSGTDVFTLHANLDADYYEFELQAGQRLQFSTEGADGVKSEFHYYDVLKKKYVHKALKSATGPDLAHTYQADQAGKYILVLKNSDAYQFNKVQLNDILLKYAIMP